MRSGRFSAPRHVPLSAQRLELAALRVDIAPHVGGDGLESRVAVERQPQGIVVYGVPPIACRTLNGNDSASSASAASCLPSSSRTSGAQAARIAQILGLVGIDPR